METLESRETRETMETQKSKALRACALFSAICFFATLLLPVADIFFKISPKVELSENRRKAEYPELKWDALDAYPTKFEAAFNDQFGFRPLLVRWHSLLKYHWLGVSPSRLVVLGKEGWLYLTSTMSEYRGKRKFSKVELSRWVADLTAKRNYLAARNIHYLLVVAPNKEGVYPEYLPDTIHRIRKSEFIDQLLAKLPPASGIEIVDLRGPLRKVKQYGPVYDRTDSHWSELGAFAATNEIVARLKKWYPELEPVPISSRKLSYRTELGGDLSMVMGINDRLTEDKIVVEPTLQGVVAGRMRTVYDAKKHYNQTPPVAFESTVPGRKYSIMMVGDSYGGKVMHFLPEHFLRTVAFRPKVPYEAWYQRMVPKIVADEKPDIYIDLIVDRHLSIPPPITICDSRAATLDKDPSAPDKPSADE